jgi:pimeloyl-ACP methyl ester carboxylesterase
MTIWKGGLPKAQSSPCPPLLLKGYQWCTHPDGSSYAKKFSGKYAHRIIEGGVGHSLPQEAPQAFAKAVVEVDGYSA